MTHVITGGIELANGLSWKWMAFIDGRLTAPEAKEEAVRQRRAWWRRGCPMLGCPPITHSKGFVMKIPDDIQRLVDDGTLTLQSNDDGQEAYFQIPGLSHHRPLSDDFVWYEVCLWTDGQVSIDENSRESGPSEQFTGDVDSAVAWIKEKVEMAERYGHE